MELETTPAIEFKSSRFTHKVGRVHRSVEADDVVAFEANMKYVDAHLRDGTCIILDQDRDTIKNLAIEFPEFVQVNRGILVRRTAITKVERNVGESSYEIITEHFVFPVSRRCVSAAREAWKNESIAREREGLCGSVCTNAG